MRLLLERSSDGSAPQQLLRQSVASSAKDQHGGFGLLVILRQIALSPLFLDARSPKGY